MSLTSTEEKKIKTAIFRYKCLSCHTEITLKIKVNKLRKITDNTCDLVRGLVQLHANHKIPAYKTEQKVRHAIRFWCSRPIECPVCKGLLYPDSWSEK